MPLESFGPSHNREGDPELGRSELLERRELKRCAMPAVVMRASLILMLLAPVLTTVICGLCTYHAGFYQEVVEASLEN
jgi:hypothetical protein